MASREEIFTAVKAQLVERGVEQDGIAMESDLMGDLNLDSLDTVELALALEEQYGVEIPEADMEDVSTVGDVVELIEKKLVDA
jgi:acyl carrier protein